MNDIRSVVGSGGLVAFAQELPSLSNQGQQGREIAEQMVDRLGAAIDLLIYEPQTIPQQCPLSFQGPLVRSCISEASEGPRLALRTPIFPPQMSECTEH